MQGRCRIIAFLLLLLTAFRPHFSGAQEAGGSLGSVRRVEQLSLQELSGQSTRIRLDDLNVFVFLSPDCPLCKNYSLTLNAIGEQYGKKVTIRGIVPGRTYTAEEVQQYMDNYKIRFPVLFDREKEFTNYAQATVTPEVLVADRNGALIYRGAIDDWVQELGKKKIKPQQHYLEEAISHYLQGQPIPVRRTKPIGCLINDY